MNAATIAPEIDRLVWAVNIRAKDYEVDYAVLEDVGLSAETFGTLNNLVPFLDELDESLVYRRYIYRPPEVLAAFIEDMLAAGVVTRHGEQLVPTPIMAPVRADLLRAIRDAARHFWSAYDVADVSEMARTVLDASPAHYGLAQAGIKSPEPEDPHHRFHQRLAGLRLLRNEAHVEAWQHHGLEPIDVEVLTAAFSGTATQRPPTPTDRLIERGYVRDGSVTEEGLAARQGIEDATNESVAGAFATVDLDAFVAGLRKLPPKKP